MGEIHDRYGQFTAPYPVQTSANRAVDVATLRAVWALAKARTWQEQCQFDEHSRCAASKAK